MDDKKLKEIVRKNLNEILYSYNGENSLCEQNLDEALIHSYDVDFVFRHLLQTFQLAHSVMGYISKTNDYIGWIEKRKVKNSCEVIILVLPLKNNAFLKDITLTMEKSCGWFLSTKINIKMDGFEAWQFEKKFDNEVTDDVLKLGKIYHLFPTSRLNKVIHVGLLPKKTTWTPFILDNEHTFKDSRENHYGWKTIDRVYFFVNKPSEDFLKNNTFSNKEIFTDTYMLLCIDTEKLIPNTKFYSDPRSENAVYTLNNIPPSAISVVG